MEKREIVFGRKVRSFTLIEVSIYLSLLVILSFVLMRMVGDVRTFSIMSSNKISNLIRSQLCFDVIFRDVISASNNINDWDEKKFIFKKSILKLTKKRDIARIVTKSVGFVVKNGNVVRYEGIYDFDRSMWLKKASSVIGRGSRVIECRLNYDNNTIKGVKIMCDSQSWYVRLRNGFV